MPAETEPAQNILEKCRDFWRNLAEIHAASQWLWSALMEKMVADGWIVQVTSDKVAKVKDVIKELPEGSHRSKST